LGLARKILKNLRTHRVAQFAAFYLGAAWILLEVAALLEQTLELPNWVDQSVLGLLVVGFPLGLIFAWFQASKSTASEADRASSDPTAPKTVEGRHETSALPLDFSHEPALPRSGGNLPIVATSFIGREAEVAELKQLLGDHRLVTLTGVGGVGKTRLALSVAEELAAEFADGVWMIELAPVGDPAAVPAAVATALGITAQADRSVTAAIAEALSGRHLLLVLDNCEHVLDAAADVVDTLLTRTTGVSVLATSREGLRVAAEHLWPVPSLDVRSGESSKAVSLFVERARAVQPGFTLGDDVEAVVDICKRLDGIALAIELAAARMVSMNPRELLDRLADRFRLLSGSRRGLERHQTLRHAVQWSYDLLSEHEGSLLSRCSVFSDGFDLVAAVHIGSDEGLDEYAVLDALDSLVRKSLVTAETAGGETRYTLLETIRQFGEEQLAQNGLVDDVRRRHANYFAKQAVEWWQIWDGPGQRDALDWIQAEFANLRSGYEWAADHDEISIAAMIAAHSAVIALPLQQFEPTKWCEELIPGASAVHLRELGLLYGAAVLCAYVGRKDEAVEYGRSAVALNGDDRYDTFDPSWNEFWASAARVIAGGDPDTFVRECEQLAHRSAHARAVGLFGMFYVLPACGRADEAIKIAADVEVATQAYGNPFWIGWLCAGYRAFTETDPEQARHGFETGLTYARDQQLPFVENRILQELAWLEGLHGVPAQAAELFDSVLDAFHRAGNHTDLRATLCYVAMFFDRLEMPEIAATVFGGSRMSAESWVVGMPSALEHLRDVLGADRFDACVATGTAMEPMAAVSFAREKIRTVQGTFEEEE
jgi:predicted ATPase